MDEELKNKLIYLDNVGKDLNKKLTLLKSDENIFPISKINKTTYKNMRQYLKENQNKFTEDLITKDKKISILQFYLNLVLGTIMLRYIEIPIKVKYGGILSYKIRKVSYISQCFFHCFI
jgi:hypothetical protein